MTISSFGAEHADELLGALGEQLAAAGEHFDLVIFGGSALLAMRPTSERSTRQQTNSLLPRAGLVRTTRQKVAARNLSRCSPISELPMPISTLRDEVQTTLVEFAWGQWAQMGVFGSTDRRDAW